MARNRISTEPANNAPADLGEAQLKKHRPKDTRLRQQRLPAWQPILNAKTVIPIFFSISIFFIPIGVVLLIISNGVKEWSIYYDTLCEKEPNPANCTLDNIHLDEDFQGDVFFYYGLENFYQNHRRYMKSRNDLQLLGQLEHTSDCDPFNTNGTHKIAPCGAIANSLFNDTFQLINLATKTPLQWKYEELIWPIDRSNFKNPKCGDAECNNKADLCAAFDGYAKPPNWQKHPCELDDKIENNGFENADFIIWMRTAAFPDFRKPYRKLADPLFPNGLPKGNYTLRIGNNYNISSFAGRKSFIISTTSWLGGKNPFLGIAFIGVGMLCAIVGAIFIVVHVKYGHSLKEMAGVEQQQQTRPTPSNRHAHAQ